MDGLRLQPFDPLRLVRDIDEFGAVSLPMIPPALRLLLCEEALCCEYKEVEENTGSSTNVQQNLTSCIELPSRGRLRRFARALERHLLNWDGGIGYALEGQSLAFNELILQKYDPTTIGISAHRDYSYDRNLVCICVLDGHGEFCLCDNRKADRVRALDTRPGNIVFMRAPGFLGEDIRPWHLVRNIVTPRIVLTLRQVNK